MSVCAVAGCDSKRYAKSYCIMHYTRLRKNGTPGDAARQRGHFGAGSVDSQGYRIIHRRGHFTANDQGACLEHRVVLFEAIGDGTHPCHWCQLPVTWRGEPRLVVDHLDDDRLNNDPSNLVPSCIQCNARRGRL